MNDREFTSESFYRYLKETHLMASECRQCQAIHLPPKPMCSTCGCTDLGWKELKGTGKVASFTSISVGPSFMVDKGHDRNNPYFSGIIELDEGPRISARILGGDPKNPQELMVGAPATITFSLDESETGQPTLTFNV